MRAPALAAIVALLLSAIAAPAGGKAKGCSLFEPGVEGAAGAPIAQVNDAATASTPLTMAISHPASAPAVAEGHSYVNIQIYSRRAHPGIYIREEFDTGNEIDLYLYNNAGKQVESSTALNLLPVAFGPLGDPDSGGVGFESIDGFRVGGCGQFTIESRSVLTQGTEATLKIWLGRPRPRS